MRYQPPQDAVTTGDMTVTEILPDNISALQQILVAHMLEELKVFEAADRLLELFQTGALPIADERPVREWAEVRGRVSAAERRSVYAHALGVPGGEPAGTPNRDFGDLWIRFVSAVSSFDRQQAPAAAAIEKQLHAAVALLSHARSELVHAKVRDLLARTSAFGSLPPEKQQEIVEDTARVAGDFVQEVDIPDFVGELIDGTFGAIVNASIQQMEAYAELVRGTCRWDRATLLVKINRIVAGG